MRPPVPLPKRVEVKPPAPAVGIDRLQEVRIDVSGQRPPVERFDRAAELVTGHGHGLALPQVEPLINRGQVGRVERPGEPDHLVLGPETEVEDRRAEPFQLQRWLLPVAQLLDEDRLAHSTRVGELIPVRSKGNGLDQAGDPSGPDDVPAGHRSDLQVAGVFHRIEGGGLVALHAGDQLPAVGVVGQELDRALFGTGGKLRRPLSEILGIEPINVAIFASDDDRLPIGTDGQGVDNHGLRRVSGKLTYFFSARDVPETH